LAQAFQRHIEAFHHSEEFKEKAKDANPFFKAIKDYVFGRPTTLENIVSICLLCFLVPTLTMLTIR
jgi:hypothetical protein